VGTARTGRGVAVRELFEPIEAVAETPKEWKEGRSPLIEFARQGEVVYPA